MLQGESHVSRDPNLLLGHMICPMSRSRNVRIKVKKKHNIVKKKPQYNSTYCELGPPVGEQNVKHKFTQTCATEREDLTRLKESAVITSIQSLVSCQPVFQFCRRGQEGQM